MRMQTPHIKMSKKSCQLRHRHDGLICGTIFARVSSFVTKPLHLADSTRCLKSSSFPDTAPMRVAVQAIRHCAFSHVVRVGKSEG